MFEVSKESAGSEVREPPQLKLEKKSEPSLVMFEVLKESLGSEVREPPELKLEKK
jgi:hypothetical protein